MIFTSSTTSYFAALVPFKRSSNITHHRLPRRSKALTSQTTTKSVLSEHPEAAGKQTKSKTLLDNVRFVLCSPQGPQNIGAVARVCQNFGLTKNFAIVNPDPQALDTCDTHDMGGEQKHDIGVECVLKEEAKKFAVHASWMIEEAEKNITHMPHGLEDALKDCTFVVATTARSRENIPFLTPKELKEVIRKEAERGKVAVLFGNEARGLSNEELKYANVCVSIPTAGHPEEMTKKFRYTGGAEPRGNGGKVDATPVSLNLSHAAGILAYEIHDALANVNADVGFTSHLLNVEERKRLADELSLARRSVDIFAPSKNVSNGEENDEEECMLDEQECLLHEKESKAIQSVLNAGAIASKNATPLFFLSRRLKILGDLRALDDIVKDFLNTKAAAPQLGSEKGISDAIRDGLGISLTNAETKRVFKYVCSKEFSRNHQGGPPVNF